jgi:hypothetical protein
MTDIRAKFAVFFGRVDERPDGWYWTVDEDLKGDFTGPFDTKADAIEDAISSGAGRLQ